MTAIIKCTQNAETKVSFNFPSIPLPNSYVRKREVAPLIDPLRNPINATIPPTTPYIP